jgi:hypothetical protein
MNSYDKYLELKEEGRIKDNPRKEQPVYSGVLAYFPNAIKYVSYVSKVSNDKHNPNEPLHWAREKSNDHLDAALRHLIDHASEEIDPDDNLMHLGKSCWRLLAELELILENKR